MSLETKIEALTQAVIALTAKLEISNVAPVAPVAQVAAPVAAPAPTFVAPVMPAAPTFVAPVAAPAPVGGAPFTDGKGLIDYVMSAYKALGPAKGASIQAVLTQLGYANINDVKPEHYGSLFSGIEALKV
jgi:hypothetical protein